MSRIQFIVSAMLLFSSTSEALKLDLLGDGIVTRRKSVSHCVTLKPITIRELHARTGRWVRAAARHGEIVVTDHGKPVARVVAEAEPPAVPYFARRKFINLAARKAIEGGQAREHRDRQHYCYFGGP